MRGVRPKVFHGLPLQVNAHNLCGAGVVRRLVVDGDGERVAEALQLVLCGLATAVIGQRAEEDFGYLCAADPVQLVTFHIQRQA